MLGGLTASSWTSLAKLYRLGAGASVDMVALNPFSAEPRSVVRIVRRARKVMSRNGDALKPLLVTETSWPSAKNRVVAPFGYEETEAGQARKLEQALLALAGERVRLRIRQVFWYTWMSLDRDPGYSFDWASIRRLESTRIATKPAYYSLRRVARALEGCGARPGSAALHALGHAQLHDLRLARGSSSSEARPPCMANTRTCPWRASRSAAPVTGSELEARPSHRAPVRSTHVGPVLGRRARGQQLTVHEDQHPVGQPARLGVRRPALDDQGVPGQRDHLVDRSVHGIRLDLGALSEGGHDHGSAARS